MDLASIHSLDDRNTMLGIGGWFPGDIWIGGNDIDNEGSFVWSDGTPWDYDHWEPTRPHSQPDISKNCVYYKESASQGKGMWWDGSCGLSKTYMCGRQVCSGAIPA